MGRIDGAIAFFGNGLPNTASAIARGRPTAGGALSKLAGDIVLLTVLIVAHEQFLGIRKHMLKRLQSQKTFSDDMKR
jgi:hypothetical protein